MRLTVISASIGDKNNEIPSYLTSLNNTLYGTLQYEGLQYIETRNESIVLMDLLKTLPLYLYFHNANHLLYLTQLRLGMRMWTYVQSEKSEGRVIFSNLVLGNN